MKRLVLVFTLLSSLSGPAVAQTISEDALPGVVEGTGVHFAVTGGSGAAVVVDSTQEITASVHSIGSAVTLKIDASATALATDITVSGLAPSTTYFKYDDDLHNAAAVTTDVDGRYVYTQDLTSVHLVFFKSEPSTLFLSDGATGGDCASIGVWDAASLTCTLTMDVANTIQIDSNNLTLNGNGHRLTGARTGPGIFLPARTGVVVTNLVIESHIWGVYLDRASGNIVSGNTITGCYEGIFLTGSSGNTIERNVLSQSSDGIWANSYSQNNSITDNTFTANGTAIWLNWWPTGNFVKGNAMDANNMGMYLTWFTSNNTIVENTISNGRVGIMTGYAWANTVVNNNLVANTYQVWNTRDFCQFYSLALPRGGNYWSDYDAPEEGCVDANGDLICDAPYTRIAYCADNLPWTRQDGWKIVTPADVIAKIQQYLADGSIDNAGVANALSSMLGNASAAHDAGNVEAAGNMLDAFINYVNAQTDKHIAAAAAAALIEDANRIRSS